MYIYMIHILFMCDILSEAYVYSTLLCVSHDLLCLAISIFCMQICDTTGN